MSRRAAVIGLLLLFAALLAAWLLRASSRQAASRHAPVSASAGRAPESSGAAALPSSVPALSARVAARAQRDALRAAIVHSLAAAEPSAAVATTTPEARPPSPAPESGTLKDRLGGREALVKALSQQFMPLAQDCIERAQREKPALRGLLGLSLHTLADEEHGAVVDVAEAAASNQIEDSALWECIRESAYSLSLPPPPSHGREAFELTIPVDAAGDLGTAPPPGPR